MQISADGQNNNLEVPKGDENRHSLATPIKKGKLDWQSSERMTAETPSEIVGSGANLSIADVDAEELFDNFSRIVTVSESQEEF